MTKYFAKLDSDSLVEAVHLVNDNIATSEQAGITYLNKLHNHSSWKACSKDGSVRKNGPAKGFTYDADKDAFIPPKPYPSWILNEDTCNWKPPVARPADKGFGEGQRQYDWNEETTTWDVAT